MSRRLLVPLGLAVTGLLVVAALASRGRPLGGGGYGSGPTAGFFDYVFTSVVIVGVVVMAIAIFTWLTNRPEFTPRRTPRTRFFQAFAFMLACGVIGVAISSKDFQRRLRLAAQGVQQTAPGQKGLGKTPAAANARSAKLRWDEVAIVLALLAGLGIVAYATRRRPREGRPWRLASQAAVSAALDESLDDLRSEPDLRKAIIAAYARMEHALARAGLPRRPAEAPTEYVERALAELETSAAAARRLTDLFEWAKFSHHAPAEQMRDEAIDALVAVRDELRRPAEKPVAA